jgi:hypothetical protein
MATVTKRREAPKSPKTTKPTRKYAIKTTGDAKIFAAAVKALNNNEVMELEVISGEEASPNFNKNNFDAIHDAKELFKNAKICSKNGTDFGVFNTGMLITKEMLGQLKKVPDFQGMFICLAAFTKTEATNGHKTIWDTERNLDLEVNSVLFPVIKVITSKGYSEETFCPKVPEYFPDKPQDGTIYYCPPLAPCPRRP